MPQPAAPAPTLPRIDAMLCCIRLDFFSPGLTLPTIAADFATTTTNLR